MVELKTENKFKRQVAFKFRIGEILSGRPEFENEKFAFLEINGKRIVRANLIGNVTDKYDSEGEKKFSTITIDDGSGQIKAKAFGDDVKKFSQVSQGQTIVVIGVLRHFNNEIYISPEVIRDISPKYLLIRKLETEKSRGKSAEPLPKDQINAVKDKILGAIKAAEETGGIEMDKLIMTLSEISPVIINQEVGKFLEEGIIFEPRPGKVRYLG